MLIGIGIIGGERMVNDEFGKIVLHGVLCKIDRDGAQLNDLSWPRALITVQY